MRNLKDSYKKCKDENKKAENERSSCPYFDDFDRVLCSRNVVKLPEFYEAGAVDEENFQESPPHEETSAAKDDEEYNSPTSKRNFSDFEENDTYLTDHGKVKQASKKAKSFHEELLNLQREQIKMFEISEKRQADFQQEMLERQLEADREFFLEFGKTLKNVKENIYI